MVECRVPAEDLKCVTLEVQCFRNTDVSDAGQGYMNRSLTQFLGFDSKNRV